MSQMAGDHASEMMAAASRRRDRDRATGGLFSKLSDFANRTQAPKNVPPMSGSDFQKGGGFMGGILDTVRDARLKDYIRNDPYEGRMAVRPPPVIDNRPIKDRLTEAMKSKDSGILPGGNLPLFPDNKKRFPFPPMGGDQSQLNSNLNADQQAYFGGSSPYKEMGDYLMNRPVFDRGERSDDPMTQFQYKDPAVGGIEQMQKQYEDLMRQAQEQQTAQTDDRQALLDRISALEGRPQQPAIDMDAMRQQIREEVMAGLPAAAPVAAPAPAPVAAPATEAEIVANIQNNMYGQGIGGEGGFIPAAPMTSEEIMADIQNNMYGEGFDVNEGYGSAAPALPAYGRRGLSARRPEPMPSAPDGRRRGDGVFNTVVGGYTPSPAPVAAPAPTPGMPDLEAIRRSIGRIGIGGMF